LFHLITEYRKIYAYLRITKFYLCRRWLPLSFLCCLLCVPALVAAVVVVGLIPTYLSTRYLGGIYTGSCMRYFFSMRHLRPQSLCFLVVLPVKVTYGTNFNSVDSSAVPNLNNLVANVYCSFFSYFYIFFLRCCS
jgi:hypothetical protein